MTVTERLVAGLAATAECTTHSDTFLAFLVVDAQIAAKLQRSIFNTGNCDGLWSVDRHPV